MMECSHKFSSGETAMIILLSIPVKFAGAITNHIEMRECALCGERVPAPIARGE